jgi:hypothetical protein
MNPEQFARFRKTPKFNEKLYNMGRVAEAEVLDKLRFFFMTNSYNLYQKVIALIL